MYGTVAKSVGKIVCAMKPRWGEKRFARFIRDRVINRDIKAQELIGLKVEDTDEVELVLNDGTQQRRLVVGQTDVPILVYPIADDRDERPADVEVFEAMKAKVSDLRSTLSLQLPYGWETGTWGNDQLAVALAAVRDG
jgi:hypothetical protein